jgi:hypothetical protein
MRFEKKNYQISKKFLKNHQIYVNGSSRVAKYIWMFNNFSFHILLMPVLAKSAYGIATSDTSQNWKHTHTHIKLPPISMAKFKFGFSPKSFNLV